MEVWIVTLKLSKVEQEVLSSFYDGSMMTLKMVATRTRDTNRNISRQSVWYALQLLVARNMIEKVDRGVYRKA
jgi:Fe2+ or Zn2+ uptake regulation protein